MRAVRRIDRPIDVRLAHGQPVAIAWGGRWRRVERCLDAWRVTGAWWEDEKERTYFRLLAGGRVYEVCAEAGGGWYLTRLYD